MMVDAPQAAHRPSTTTAPRDIRGRPAGILLYNLSERSVLLAEQQLANGELSYSCGWGKCQEGDVTFLKTAIREHREEIGSKLPGFITLLAKARPHKMADLVSNGKGCMYMYEVPDADMPDYHTFAPTDGKTKRVAWVSVDELSSLRVRFETKRLLERRLLPLMGGGGGGGGSNSEPATKRARPDVVNWYARVGMGEELTVTEELNTTSLKILQSLKPEWLFKNVRDETPSTGGTRCTWDKAISKMTSLYKTECAGGHDVQYTYRVYDGKRLARRYAKGSVKGVTALQHMKSGMRPACVRGVDVDGVKMFFNLMCDLAENAERDYPCMVEYAQQGGRILGEVQRMYGCTKKVAKLLFNTIYADREDADIIGKWRKKNRVMACNGQWESGWFATFVANVRACRKELLARWPSFVDAAKWSEAQPEYKQKNGSYSNITGKAISYLLQSAEDVCIEELRLFYKSEFNIRIVALMFDGILFEGHHDVQTKLERAQEHIRKTFGWSHFKLDEKPFDCAWHTPGNEANKAITNFKLQQLDARYCATMMESKPKVIDMGAIDDSSDHRQPKHLFLDPPAFKEGIGRQQSGYLLYEPTKEEEDVLDSDGNVVQQITKYKYTGVLAKCNSSAMKDCGGGNVCKKWYHSDVSTTADAVTFNLHLAPGLQKEPDEYGRRVYNMWRGLQVVSVPCAKFDWDVKEAVDTDGDGEVTHRWHTDNPILHFVLHSLCGGCKERFDYLLLWCAISVTYPQLNMPVAIVCKGPQGVGKGMLANELMGSYFGTGLHFVHCSNPDHITGEKNALLGMAVFTSMDECFQRGDHKAKAVLKSLLTESTAVLRKLFCDAVTIRTFNHLFISSNEDMCAYLDHDDRRYAVLNCMDTHANDKTYWRRVAGYIANGGREAFLHHLLYGMRAKVDAATNGGRTQLSFIPAIMDADRFEMKILSAKPVQKWLYHSVLRRSDKSFLHYLVAVEQKNSTRYPLLLNRRSMFVAFNQDCGDRAKQYVDETTFIGDVLKYLNTGRHSTTKYIKSSYTSYKVGGYMGVEGTSVADCIVKMRRGFLACCKLDPDEHYDAHFGCPDDYDGWAHSDDDMNAEPQDGTYDRI
jgi:hypothetical protein